MSGESDTTNNCSDAVVVIVLPRPPDLLVDGLKVDNDSLAAGQLFTVSVIVQNLGMRARATTLRFYRSADSTISSDDDFEGALYISELNEFERTNESMPSMALSMPGTYYYGACVDPVRGESDTTNNCSDAIAITVIPPTPSPTPIVSIMPTPEVVSKSEPFSIKGVMIGPDDRTVTDTALSVWRGDEEFWVETEPDGSFSVEVPAGSFKLQVWLRKGNQYHEVGWYDSNGSITSDPAQAFEVVVRDTDIDDLRITLPASFTPTPTKSESFKITGVLIGPDDRAVTDTALSVWRGDEEFWVGTEPDGSFSVEVPAGSFKLQVWVRAGDVWYSAGWYGGSGSIIHNQTQASEVVISDTGISDLRLMLSEDAESLISRYEGNGSDIVESGYWCPLTSATTSIPWTNYVGTTTVWPRLPPVRTDMAEMIALHFACWTDEVRTVIDDLRERSPELAAQVEALPWIGDGVQFDMEGYAAMGLIRLADAGHLAKLIEEPWVVEGRNYPALWNLVISNISFDPPEVYNWVVDHPALNDGISDREAKLLASLGSPDDVGRFDPESPHTIEERIIILPLAGEVELTIIRTDPERGYAGMMDDLEHSIRSQEDFMGVPFPGATDHLCHQAGRRRGAAWGHLRLYWCPLPRCDRPRSGPLLLDMAKVAPLSCQSRMGPRRRS